ncbi:SapC family protein [Sphingomonas sp. VNH70]|uniref:SapC family protein n=1 Tax=Sphingomonas silueang TaxID=3156617 RepID=UPI0032B48840
MPNHVALDNIAHHDLTVAPVHGAAYGDGVNQVLLLPPEFEAAQRDYPILLRRAVGGDLYAVALLGFAQDDNLFLSDGGWDASYVPAVRRRGPFASGPDGVQVDLDDPRVARGGGGEPLYRAHGGTAPYLAHIEGVLDVVATGRRIAPSLYAAWDAAGLLRPTAIDVELGDGETMVIEDVLIVAEDRLAALDGQVLADLHRSGALRAAYMVAASLDNIARLIARHQRRTAA